MKNFIESHLYHPGIVLPLLGLTRVLISTDFSLGQTGLVIALRGTRMIWNEAARVWHKVPQSVQARAVRRGKHWPASRVAVPKPVELPRASVHIPDDTEKSFVALAGPSSPRCIHSSCSYVRVC